MKLITLNTFGGTVYDPLLQFLRSHQNVDVFCFQEVWHNAAGRTEHLDLEATPDENLFVTIGEQLPNHQGFFRPHAEDFYGLAMFINKSFPIFEEGETFVYLYKGFIPSNDLGNHARNIQFIQTEQNKKPIAVINFHGLWNGKGKTDTPERLEQSKKVLDHLKTISGDVVLCGDFNLSPNTESIKMFEDFGLRNLIKEYGITSTRTSLYEKENKFADYIFVSPGITVTDFKVLPDEVSDHAPLYLEFA
ncbi:MAG TPA: endonuclease/exonuclease/phosphatase family protein [Candidatus Paceibacterota bacterium]|nr:endonuclease/exonuclease/phosphatase family protein [Candidatus Paceibacterota bacterium]